MIHTFLRRLDTRLDVVWRWSWFPQTPLSRRADDAEIEELMLQAVKAMRVVADVFGQSLLSIGSVIEALRDLNKAFAQIDSERRDGQ